MDNMWQRRCAKPETVTTSTLECSQSGLANYLIGRDEPLVIEQLVAEWPLVQAAKASNESLCDYLLEFDRGAVVDAIRLPASADGRMFYNDDITGFNFSRVKMPFKTALGALLAEQHNSTAETLYVGSTTVDSCLPGLLGKNKVAIESLDPLGTLWIGNKSRIAAHYDAPDNLICVASGKRRVTLFPPSQTKNLYVGPLHFTPAGQPISMVDFSAPDLNKYPRFEEAMKHALVVELLPGDALYIPSMWWHHIEGTESINLLINYWWRNVPAYIGRSENALYHALLTLKQLPKAQRRAWQALFDHYVFDDDGMRFNHIPPSKQGPLGELDENTVRQFKAWLVNNLKH
ncbi:cupin-like domain-containing protein [Alteromonas marina]|uniref:cupin-like domain-containing protein n=1 Tax=unclassified Alteromonas TaxID=2614992 RepID=UPI0012E4B147|nr:cupin-like domain-containing protein [Alteromonas sp. KUL150]GFD86754.1 cupin [Alteromonas sp. KUL150]|tara:strand:- start:1956 stop:2993 length:1038 start_codon:yes stop_codon:yes gene_type:complete